MLGLVACDRRHGLDDVQPVHRLVLVEAVAVGIGRGHRQEAGETDAAEEVGVQREDHVRVGEVVLRVVVVAEGGLGGGAGGVVVHRLVLHELGLRILRLHLLPLRGERGRGDGLGEEVDAFAGSGLGDGAGELLLELGELGLLAAEARMLRAVGIVEVEQRALREGVAAALRSGVLGIAFELDGAEGFALDQHRNRAGGERMRRRKVHRPAEDEVLRLLDVGEDRLVGLLGAAGESGQREARAHDLEEAAAADGVHPLAGGGLAGKLLLHQLLEGGRSGQLIQVLPEALAGLAFELASAPRRASASRARWC